MSLSSNCIKHLRSTRWNCVCYNNTSPQTVLCDVLSIPASNISQVDSLVTLSAISVISILALQVYTLLSEVIIGLKLSCRLVPEEEDVMTEVPSYLVHCIVGSTTRCGTTITVHVRVYD